MGNTNSSNRSSDVHVFQKELSVLNATVNNLLNENDVFKNKDYNFLSQDVCDKYKVVLEEELEKHLKLSIKALGTSLYILPNDEDNNDKLTKHNLTKKQVCEKISNHYIKILYILSLIKYVYNIEQDGDLSIAGIIYRNIRVLDDIMEINFCDLPHRNYNSKTSMETYKINFSKLEGFKFFVDYFLDRPEASAFVSVMRSILARNSKQKFSSIVCQHISNKTLKPEDVKYLEDLYMKKYGSKLVCKSSDKTRVSPVSKHSVNIDIFVNRENPILAKEFCFAPRKITIKTSNIEGKKVLAMYNQMKKNYEENISNIYTLLNKFITPSNGTYILKDIDKTTLDTIIEDVKIKVKVFYIQSIVDFQMLLDQAKLIPNIESS